MRNAAFYGSPARSISSGMWSCNAASPLARTAPADRSPGSSRWRIRLIREAYGLHRHAPLIETILWWQDRCWRGIQAGALTGQTRRRCGYATPAPLKTSVPAISGWPTTAADSATKIDLGGSRGPARINRVGLVGQIEGLGHGPVHTGAVAEPTEGACLSVHGEADRLS
ncbi:hypothetical protein FAIPA1_400037 [Frankia sp. AiPs1]